jgi:hypothetical protein
MSIARTRDINGNVISPAFHLPAVQITTPYVPHPLMLAGHIPMPNIQTATVAVAGRSTEAIFALARSGSSPPFTFNGMPPG